MEKKIGLVAPHKSTNYGTLLQAYALAKVIADMGYPCEYISYSMVYKHSILERIWNKLKRMCGYATISSPTYEGIDDMSFWFSDEFRPLLQTTNRFYNDCIPHSTLVYNPKSIWKSNWKYRKFIVGSDQTWSMEHYNYEKAYYFLSFVIGKSRKYAYAPSIGTTQLTNKHKQLFASYLPSFKALSCRERSNSEELSRLLHRDVSYVADPTLLIRKEDWIKFAHKAEELPNRYILAYILGERKCVSEFAERLSKEKGIPVHYVLTRPKYLKMVHSLKCLTPEQWIYAIANAECIVTDSFHGSLFSINMERDFYVFTKRTEGKDDLNDNDRIMELLSSFGLQSRYVDEYMMQNNLVDNGSIDYRQVLPIFDKLRMESEAYLSSIVK